MPSFARSRWMSWSFRHSILCFFFRTDTCCHVLVLLLGSSASTEPAPVVEGRSGGQQVGCRGGSGLRLGGLGSSPLVVTSRHTGGPALQIHVLHGRLFGS